MTDAPSDSPDVHTRPRHRMVDRVAAILELIARAPAGLTLTELAKTLDAPVSSTQGLVNGLVATGYVDERQRRYMLGAAPSLLNLIAGRRLVRAVQHADLESIQQETNLTTLLSIAVGHDVYYVDHSSKEPTYAYLAENFVRRSLIRTSGGWVLLADLPKRDLWAYLQSLPDSEEKRVENFLAALPELRATGICAGPRSSDVADGVSIAVREGGRTVAAVGVVGDAAEIAARRDDLVDMLRRYNKRWSDG